jgi:hypothetical protein
MRMVLASAAAVVLVVAGIWWLRQQSLDGPGTSARTARWGDLSWQVPAGWYVSDAQADQRYYRYGEMLEGPFVSTVPTRSICRTTANGWECGRPLGVIQRPVDGVIAWVSLGLEPDVGTGNADQGPSVTGVCGGALGGRIFHMFRTFGTTSNPVRVALDGCIFGPATGTYEAQLSHIGDTLRYRPG